MMSLTTTQRDLLYLLMTAEIPIGATAIGQQLRLTPRQIHYCLREIRHWLSLRNATMRHTPGVGVQIFCTADQKQRLLAELSSQSKFQLILTPGQRQQLLALQLLTAHDPLVLSQLRQDVVVARATVLKDLDAVASWLDSFHLQIARRQHRGCWVAGAELARRQRDLVVFGPRRVAVGYTVVPEARWTTPEQVHDPSDVILGAPGSNLYLEPHVTREYPAHAYALLQNPRRPARRHPRGPGSMASR